MKNTFCFYLLKRNFDRLFFSKIINIRFGVDPPNGDLVTDDEDGFIVIDENFRLSV